MSKFIKSSRTSNRRYDWGGALQGGASGAMMGSKFGPVGTVAGAAIGIGASIFGSAATEKADRLRKQAIQDSIQYGKERQQGDAEEARYTTDASSLSQYKLNNTNSLYMRGGKIKRFAKGGEVNSLTKSKYETTRVNWTDPNLGDLYQVEPSPENIANPSIYKVGKDDNGNDMYATQHNNLPNVKYSNNTMQKLPIDPSSPNRQPVRMFDPGNALARGTQVADTTGTSSNRNRLLQNVNNNSTNSPAFKNKINNLYKGNLLATPTKVEYAKGGAINIPNSNTQQIDPHTRLILNNQGGTSGTHEQGDNIPMYEDGSHIGNVEPGELVTTAPNGDNVVLSKRLGFAGRYIQLEKMQKSIENEKKMLPYMNEQVANKLNIGKQKWGGGLLSKRKFEDGGDPDKDTSILSMLNGVSNSSLNNGLSTVSAIGNLISTSNGLTSQANDIKDMIRYTNSQSPILNKVALAPTNVDVSDQVNNVQQGFNDVRAKLGNITDPGERNALLNSANNSRSNNLLNINANKNRLQSDLIGRNIQSINQNNSMNTQIQNVSNEEKTQRNLQGMSALSSITGQRTTNRQGFINELGQIRKDNLSLQAIKASHKEIGDTFEGDNTNPLIKNIVGKLMLPRATKNADNMTDYMASYSKFDPSKIDMKRGGKIKSHKNRMYAK